VRAHGHKTPRTLASRAAAYLAVHFAPVDAHITHARVRSHAPLDVLLDLRPQRAATDGQLDAHQLEHLVDARGSWNHEVSATVIRRYTDRQIQTGVTVITLTEPAARKVKELLEAEGATDLALRVAVRPGGCSGYSYEMFFDGDVAADDEKAEFGADPVKVVVDSASAQLLEGATLDYKDGLNQAGFAITNPNAQRSCGCGQSFS